MAGAPSPQHARECEAIRLRWLRERRTERRGPDHHGLAVLCPTALLPQPLLRLLADALSDPRHRQGGPAPLENSIIARAAAPAGRRRGTLEFGFCRPRHAGPLHVAAPLAAVEATHEVRNASDAFPATGQTIADLELSRRGGRDITCRHLLVSLLLLLLVAPARGVPAGQGLRGRPCRPRRPTSRLRVFVGPCQRCRRLPVPHVAVGH